MPANGRWDLIRRLKVNDSNDAFIFFGLSYMMGKKRNTCKILIGISNVRAVIGRSKRAQKPNI